MNSRELYENIGHLFYAIASADGNVRKEEEDKLYRELNKIWLPIEQRSKDKDMVATHYMFIAFDYLKERNMLPEEAYLVFESYFNMHKKDMDEELQKAIQYTAAAIALSFNGYNKAELHYLSRLHLLMKQDR